MSRHLIDRKRIWVEKSDRAKQYSEERKKAILKRMQISFLKFERVKNIPMNSINTNNLGSKSLVLYVLIICNIAGFSFYVVNAIRYQAPLLSFWLPAFAFFVLYSYISADEYKKLDTRPTTREQTSWKSGIFALLFLIFVFAMKNWKASPLDFSDAFILALFLSNAKDHIIEVLTIRKFTGTSDQK